MLVKHTPKMKNRLAIADNNPIRRDGIRAILQQGDFEVTYANTCPETLNGQLGEIDILIWGVDAGIPVNKDLIHKLCGPVHRLKIIVIDNNCGLKAAVRAISAGADAYITDMVQKDELLFTIKYVLQGKKYIDPIVTMNLFSKLSDFEEHISHLNTNLTLSDRENEVLDLMVCGYANKEIAYKLFTTKRNIEDLRQSLITKTGAKDNLSLILYRLHQEFITN